MPYGSVEVLESARELDRRRHHHHRRRCSPAQLWNDCCSLACFHLFNALFLLISLLLLVALVLSVALLPLCGLGVQVLALVFRSGAVAAAVSWDVEVADMHVTLYDHMLADVITERSLLVSRGAVYRRVSGLESLSLESLKVLFYLVTVKILVALLSLFLVGAVCVMPALLSLLARGNSHWWETLCSVFVVALLFVSTCIFMDVAARLSIAATCFFCCERVLFASVLPRVVPTRSNVVVVRLLPTTRA